MFYTTLRHWEEWFQKLIQFAIILYTSRAWPKI